MVKLVILGKNFLRIVLAGWMIGTPCLESQATEESEKNLKRPHDDSCIEEPTLKKQKVDTEAEFMDVIVLPEDPLQEITPLSYTNDILRYLASFLDLHSYQAFRCVDKQTYKTLNDGWGLVYEHRFDRPETYVTNLLNQFSNIQLDLILGQNLQSKENNEKAIDFTYSILQSKFPDKVRRLYIRPDIYYLELNEKMILIKDFIIKSISLNLKILTTCEEMFEKNTKSYLAETLKSQTCQKTKFLNLVNTFTDINNNNSLMVLIKKTTDLRNLSFNDDLEHRLDPDLYFSDYFFEELPKALACNHSLTSLNFQGCHFELAQVPPILAMMEHANTTLTTLILDDNLFGVEGIGMILTKNKELNVTNNKSLKNISFKRITYSGGVEDDSILEKFIEVLRTESSLSSLSLSVQLVDLKRNFALLPKILFALSTNTTLEKLCLFSVPLCETDKKSLTEFFHTNTTLKRLELPNCFANIGPKNYFVDAFKENRSIQELILDDDTKIYFGEKNREQIKEILHRNLLISMGKWKG